MSSYSMASRRSSGSNLGAALLGGTGASSAISRSGLQMARLLAAARGLGGGKGGAAGGGADLADPLSALYGELEKARLRYAVTCEVRLIGLAPDMLVLENWAFVMRAIEGVDVEETLAAFRRDAAEDEAGISTNIGQHPQPHEGTDFMKLRGDLFVDQNCDFPKLLGGFQNGIFGKKTTLKSKLWAFVGLVKNVPGAIALTLKMAKAKEAAKKGTTSDQSVSMYDRSQIVGAALKGAEHKELWASQAESTNMYGGGVIAVRGAGPILDPQTLGNFPVSAPPSPGDPEIIFQHREYLIGDVADCVKLAEQVHKEMIEWHVESGLWSAVDFEDAQGRREVRLLPAGGAGEFFENGSRPRGSKRRTSLVGRALTNVRESYTGE
ncbi:unnamed protein product [Amoebophrya sp. A120]|nr:unnamed protein product [Amoebophrya sp. A120]|eukprot:GSA120T00002125001.1